MFQHQFTSSGVFVWRLSLTSYSCTSRNSLSTPSGNPWNWVRIKSNYHPLIMNTLVTFIDIRWTHLITYYHNFYPHFFTIVIYLRNIDVKWKCSKSYLLESSFSINLNLPKWRCSYSYLLESSFSINLNLLKWRCSYSYLLESSFSINLNLPKWRCSYSYLLESSFSFNLNLLKWRCSNSYLLESSFSINLNLLKWRCSYSYNY